MFAPQGGRGSTFVAPPPPPLAPSRGNSYKNLVKPRRPASPSSDSYSSDEDRSTRRMSRSNLMLPRTSLTSATAQQIGTALASYAKPQSRPITQPAPPASGIVCNVCESEPAELRCTSAECSRNALLCRQCDTQLHRPQKLQLHSRVPLSNDQLASVPEELTPIPTPTGVAPSLPAVIKCMLCESKVATKCCGDCEFKFHLVCADCDVGVHAASAKTRAHVRIPYPSSVTPGSVATSLSKSAALAYSRATAAMTGQPARQAAASDAAVKCQLCESGPATVSCQQCPASTSRLCSACDSEVHRAKKLALHSRSPLYASPNLVRVASKTSTVSRPDSNKTLTRSSSSLTKLIKAAPDNTKSATGVVKCTVCEQKDAAVLCQQCQKPYCADCNTEFHQPAKLSGHTFTPLSVESAQAPLCSVCETKVSSSRCNECAQPYCDSCSAEYHAAPKFQQHTSQAWPWSASVTVSGAVATRLTSMLQQQQQLRQHPAVEHTSSSGNNLSNHNAVTSPQHASSASSSLCGHCKQRPAERRCRQCTINYCIKCSADQHKSQSNRHHIIDAFRPKSPAHPEPRPMSPPKPKVKVAARPSHVTIESPCNICEEPVGLEGVYCHDCRSSFCQGCSDQQHKPKKYQNHDVERLVTTSVMGTTMVPTSAIFQPAASIPAPIDTSSSVTKPIQNSSVFVANQAQITPTQATPTIDANALQAIVNTFSTKMEQLSQALLQQQQHSAATPTSVQYYPPTPLPPVIPAPPPLSATELVTAFREALKEQSAETFALIRHNQESHQAQELETRHFVESKLKELEEKNKELEIKLHVAEKLAAQAPAPLPPVFYPPAPKSARIKTVENGVNTTPASSQRKRESPVKKSPRLNAQQLEADITNKVRRDLEEKMSHTINEQMAAVATRQMQAMEEQKRRLEQLHQQQQHQHQQQQFHFANQANFHAPHHSDRPVTEKVTAVVPSHDAYLHPAMSSSRFDQEDRTASYVASDDEYFVGEETARAMAPPQPPRTPNHVPKLNLPPQTYVEPMSAGDAAKQYDNDFVDESDPLDDFPVQARKFPPPRKPDPNRPTKLGAAKIQAAKEEAARRREAAASIVVPPVKVGTTLKKPWRLGQTAPKRVKTFEEFVKPKSQAPDTKKTEKSSRHSGGITYDISTGELDEISASQPVKPHGQGGIAFTVDSVDDDDIDAIAVKRPVSAPAPKRFVGSKRAQSAQPKSIKTAAPPQSNAAVPDDEHVRIGFGSDSSPISKQTDNWVRPWEAASTTAEGEDELQDKARAYIRNLMNSRQRQSIDGQSDKLSSSLVFSDPVLDSSENSNSNNQTVGSASARQRLLDTLRAKVKVGATLNSSASAINQTLDSDVSGVHDMKMEDL